MFKKSRIALAALLTVFACPVFSQDFAPNLPVLNGASYCGVTVNTVCVQTIPAGPAMSGAETLPADTNAASGQSPQSVKVPLAVLGAGPYLYNAPLTGASITIPAVTRQVILEPAGTIATLTLVFPAATGLLDGQKLNVCSTQIVTALTITNGSGTTVINPPTATTVPVTTGAASCFGWIYRLANTSWYRIQ